MYIGTHYNSYYNSLFGDRGSVYGSFAKAKINASFTPVNNTAYNPASVKYVQDLKDGANALKDSINGLVTGKDTQYTAQKAEDLVSAYNKLYGAAFNNIGDSKANNLLSQLTSVSRTYASSLAQVGVSFDSKGYMQADGDQLAKAAQDGSLERLFSGSGNYGFAGQLNRIAGNVVNNTANYVSPSTLGQGLIDSLYNFNYNFSYNNNFLNTYQSFMGANNSFNSGMLFDFLL